MINGYNGVIDSKQEDITNAQPFHINEQYSKGKHCRKPGAIEMIIIQCSTSE